MGLLFKRAVFKVFGSFKIRRKDQEPEKGEKENGEKEDVKDNTYYPDTDETLSDPCNKEKFKPEWMYDYTNGCSPEYQRDIDEFQFGSNQPDSAINEYLELMDSPAYDELFGRIGKSLTILKTKKTTFHEDEKGILKPVVSYLPDVSKKRNPYHDSIRVLIKTGMIRPDVETRLIINKPYSEICESTSNSSFSPNAIACSVRKTEMKVVEDETGDLKKTLVALPDEIYLFGPDLNRNIVNASVPCSHPETTVQTLLSYVGDNRTAKYLRNVWQSGGDSDDDYVYYY